MLKTRLVWLALLLVLIFVLGLGLGFVVPRLAGLQTGSRYYSTATLLRQVQDLSELVTVKYVMEKVVILEVPPESTLGQFIAGNNRILLVAHGVVKAGLDLSQMKPGDVEISDKRVVLRLPHARITDAYLDDSKTQVIEHTTGFLRSFDKDLEKTARQNAVDDIRRAARTGGILKDAETKARDTIKALLQHKDLQVEFKEP